ncbi:maleylpyruvate isomerase N-terminal domain-containing protein [Mycolicibacterium aubagnense]
MDLARLERRDLVEFLGGLTTQQWEQPSLCTGWRVRDVVGHIIGYDELTGAQTVREFLRGGLFPPRINAAVRARTGSLWAGGSPADGDGRAALCAR